MLIGAGLAVIDGEHDPQQFLDGASQVRICDLVACSAALRGSDDESASSKAGEMVRYVRSRQPEVLGQGGWEAGGIEQRDEDAGSVVVGHRASQAAHGRQARLISQHMLTIQ